MVAQTAAIDASVFRDGDRLVFERPCVVHFELRPCEVFEFAGIFNAFGAAGANLQDAAFDIAEVFLLFGVSLPRVGDIFFSAAVVGRACAGKACEIPFAVVELGLTVGVAGSAISADFVFGVCEYAIGNHSFSGFAFGFPFGGGHDGVVVNFLQTVAGNEAVAGDGAGHGVGNCGHFVRIVFSVEYVSDDVVCVLSVGKVHVGELAGLVCGLDADAVAEYFIVLHIAVFRNAGELPFESCCGTAFVHLDVSDCGFAGLDRQCCVRDYVVARFVFGCGDRYCHDGLDVERGVDGFAVFLFLENEVADSCAVGVCVVSVQHFFFNSASA